MNQSSGKNRMYAGAGLAILAVLIWSGNFIVARGIIRQMPPVSLAFWRWLTASLLIAPWAIGRFKAELPIVRLSWKYLFWVSLTGIALFNTFVYIAGHYSPAINLAIIGTTSSPIMATVLAVIFLKEAITSWRIAGLLICVSGIVLLLSKGSWQTLVAFRFSTGDLWILLGALMFAIYTTLAKRKPAGISPVNFLFIIFTSGTLLLLPGYLWETTHQPPVIWNANLIYVILYLGAGTSVAAYLCWNAAIRRLGSAATASFGNLIPIFSTLEAIIILKEQITGIHIISGLLVIGGLVIANLKKRTPPIT